MKPYGKSLLFPHMSFAGVQDSKAFNSQTSMLGSCIPCTTGIWPCIYHTDECTKESVVFLYFFVISVLAWATVMLLKLSSQQLRQWKPVSSSAISCSPFFTPMSQQKEFIKGVKCLVIITGRKTNLAIFDHRDFSLQPLKSVLSLQ